MLKFQLKNSITTTYILFFSTTNGLFLSFFSKFVSLKKQSKHETKKYSS